MKPLDRVLYYWEHQPKAFVVLVGLLVVMIIGMIDYFTTTDFSLALFYLLPIAFTAWFASKWSSVSLSVLAALIWMVDDLTFKSGSNFWLASWNAAINLGFFIVTSYLIATLKLLYEREKHLARTDPLTGVINRRYFLELLQKEIERSRRHHDSLTLVYLDVDNFKDVNDHLGHSMGDQLLCLIGQTIHDQIRGIDFFARLGGDEFAVLLPQTGYDQAETVLSRLHHALLETVNQQAFAVSFSIGAVTFMQPPASADRAIEQADRLMYVVKESGKDGLQHIAMDAIEPTEIPSA